jgi:hypothetical protein
VADSSPADPEGEEDEDDEDEDEDDEDEDGAETATGTTTPDEPADGEDMAEESPERIRQGGRKRWLVHKGFWQEATRRGSGA